MLAGFVWFLLSGIAASQCVSVNTTWGWRLPRTSYPTSYDLNFTLSDPNDYNGTAPQFSGVVQINLTVTQPTSCLVINMGSNMQVAEGSNVLFRLASGQVLAGTTSFNSSSTMLVIDVKTLLKPGVSGTLTINFVGTHNNKDATGFFLSENVYEPTGMNPADALRIWGSHSHRKRTSKPLVLRQNTEKMFATQFEQMYARQAFPCFDEPELKARFTATFRVPNTQIIVLFNTPVVTRTVVGDSVVFEFATTKHVMSSYLVAMAVGRFDFVEKVSPVQGGIPFRVYTPPGYGSYGQFALDTSVKIVDYFSQLWNFPLSNMLEKFDQIMVAAVDWDAMENWGLLTYATEFLLVPPNGTRQQFEMVALVTIHEIVHQWFGDTVTMPWWTGEYLNEGFARYFQYVGVDALFPEWDVFNERSIFTPLMADQSFYGFTYNRAMTADYKGTAPPIYLPEQDDGQEVSTIFYEKGASVNRMFYLWRPKCWNSALATHVARFRWTNPSEFDLVDSLSANCDPAFRDNMLPWLNQAGFPIVSLKYDSSNYTVTATQQPVSSLLPASQTWFVPLEARAVLVDPNSGLPINPGKTILFDLTLPMDRASSYTLPAPPQNQAWAIEGNFNYTGFYLVNYLDFQQWNFLLAKLDDPELPPVQRQQLTQQIYFLSQAHPPSPSVLQPLLTATKGAIVSKLEE